MTTQDSSTYWKRGRVELRAAGFDPDRAAQTNAVVTIASAYTNAHRCNNRVRAITDLLAIEEKVDRASRDKVRSQKREIPEGSEEWDILQKRYYAEELKKFGIDLAR